ncbi:MAG: DMT family transporter [Deltaproteobacteria bacterium]|jgi:drug/metabolite transporter (DMT)-like permease
MKIFAKSDDRVGSSSIGKLKKVDGAWLRTTAYTAFALIAFAANSVLCRLALGEGAIDAASFTTIRLISGALVLLFVNAAGKIPRSGGSGNWTSAFMLFLYAVTFSFAYISLNTGTGALILFAAVQATMIIFAVYKGERLRPGGWLGLLIGLMGLTYLVVPGLTAPSPSGAALMTIAGVSWGIYSLRGRGSLSPVAVTTHNFLRSTPFVIVIGLIFFQNLHMTFAGVFFAALSGGLTSAIGYVIWYAALQDHSATSAALVQLLVPVLAALGGVLLLSEAVTMRLLLSSAMIIGGVALALTQRKHSVPAKSEE